MADLTIRWDIRLSAAQLRCGAALLLMPLVATNLASESVTLTTYFPAPSSIYTQLITAQSTYLARDGGYLDVGTTAALPAGAKMSVMGGNVGVGTTSPAYPLDVTGTTTIGIRYVKNWVGATQDARITVGDTTHSWSVTSGWTGSTAGDFDILEEGVNSFMHIKAGSGYVGFGAPPAANPPAGDPQTWPAATLDVNGTPNLATSCGAANATGFAEGVVPCGGGTFATWYLGIYTYYQTGSQDSLLGNGTMYCCPCPAGACSL